MVRQGSAAMKAALSTRQQKSHKLSITSILNLFPLEESAATAGTPGLDIPTLGYVAAELWKPVLLRGQRSKKARHRKSFSDGATAIPEEVAPARLTAPARKAKEERRQHVPAASRAPPVNDNRPAERALAPTVRSGVAPPQSTLPGVGATRTQEHSARVK